MSVDVPVFEPIIGKTRIGDYERSNHGNFEHTFILTQKKPTTSFHL